MDYTLTPPQYMAGKIASGILFAAITTLLLIQLDFPHYGLAILLGLFGFLYPDLWLSETTKLREQSIFKELPFYIDVIILCVEAGANMTTALTYATQKSMKGPLNTEINRVLRDIRAGKSRADALRAMADRLQLRSINSLTSSIIQAERMGASLGPILRAQADQRRSERFQKAEKKAMEAPVKLLGPLIMFIFPNTFFVIGFLLIVKAIEGAVFPDAIQGYLEWALWWPNIE